MFSVYRHNYFYLYFVHLSMNIVLNLLVSFFKITRYFKSFTHSLHTSFYGCLWWCCCWCYFCCHCQYNTHTNIFITCDRNAHFVFIGNANKISGIHIQFIIFFRLNTIYSFTILSINIKYKFDKIKSFSLKIQKKCIQFHQIINRHLKEKRNVPIIKQINSMI